jgi:hypothetical protein
MLLHATEDIVDKLNLLRRAGPEIMVAAARLAIDVKISRRRFSADSV